MALKRYSVVWTAEAIRNKNKIADYLIENWSERELRNFYRELDRRIKLISHKPELYQLVEDTDYTRRSVLNKHTIIFYEFKNEVVEILYLFNTRRDPDSLDL